MKKTIALSTLLAASLASANPMTSEEAMKNLTGPNQPATGENSICVAVSPYEICSLALGGVMCSGFHSFQINGASFVGTEQGSCTELNTAGSCETGYVKITSTAPISCNVPIGL